MRFIDKMERKFGRYAIRGLMKYVIACYIIGYVLLYTVPGVLNFLTLEPYMIFHHGQIWRLISWVLIPPSRSNIIFVIFMLILYYQLGTVLEQTWGAFRFNLYIFGGVIFTILGALVLYLVLGVNAPVSIGASFSTYYINMTIFLAFAVCYPNMQVMLYFLIPIKMKWMAVVYGVLIAYEFVISGWAGRVAFCVCAEFPDLLPCYPESEGIFAERSTEEEEFPAADESAPGRRRILYSQMRDLWAHGAG